MLFVFGGIGGFGDLGIWGFGDFLTRVGQGLPVLASGGTGGDKFAAKTWATLQGLRCRGSAALKVVGA